MIQYFTLPYSALYYLGTGQFRWETNALKNLTLKLPNLITNALSTNRNMFALIK
jgi:hypothetical protein